MSAALEVLAAGPALSIQDGGRRGLAHLGISRAGAMDMMALRAVNALCGNAPDAAAIECGPGGCRLRIGAGSARLAVAGAEVVVTLDGAPCRPGASFTARQGQVLAVTHPRGGVWCMIGVSGGIATPKVMGSRSTHWRSGLGGRLLQPGDDVPLAAATAPDGPERAAALPLPHPGEGPIRVMPGPQEAAFTDEALAGFLATEWLVGRAIDRMAYHLEGPALAHADGFNIVSDGVVRGSVQVPGHGRPIVMMADCQTTGGYPKIATVVSADLGRLAQAAPGTAVRFAAVALDEALAARRRLEEDFAGWVRAIRDADGVDDAGRSLASERLLALNLVDGAVSAMEGA